MDDDGSCVFQQLIEIVPVNNLDLPNIEQKSDAPVEVCVYLI